VTDPSVESPRGWRLLAPLDAAIASLAGLLAGLIYWLGAAPGVLFGDGGELQFAAWTAGLPHPTGYPLYMLLGWAWSHLLAGLNLTSPARAMNLLSVGFAVFAVMLTYLLARTVIELAAPASPAIVQRLAALLATLTFAFTPTFWSQALITEVYTLHAAFVALLLGLSVRWYKEVKQERAGGEPGPFTFRSQPVPALIVLALLLGFSLAHHRTTLLLIPVLVIFIWRQDGYRLRRPRWLISLGLLTLLPLSLYLYVPLRLPHSDYLQMELAPGQTIDLINRSPRGVIGYILGRTFASELEGASTLLANLAGLPGRFLAELGPVGLGLALLGLLTLLATRRRRLLWLTGGSFVLLTGFNLVYTIEDIQVFYIPSYLIAALWIGVAAAWIGQEFTRQLLRWQLRPLPAGRLAGLLLLLPLLALPGWLFLTHADSLDRSGHTWPDQWWRRLLAADPPAGALLISNDRDEIMPLWYMQQVEGLRPDLNGLFPGLLPGEGWANIGQVLDNGLASGRPAYLIKPMPELAVKVALGPNDSAGLTPVTGLAAGRTPMRPQDSVIGDLVRLTGYDVSLVQVQPGQAFDVDLYWQPLQKMPVDYTSFVHLRLPNGERIAQSDILLGGVYYPTSLWKPGEVLLDRHRIDVPVDAPPGPYELQAGMYQLVGSEAETIGSLRLNGSVGGRPPASAINATVANPFYANLDDLVLLVGYELAGQRLIGGGQAAFSVAEQVDGLQVTLLWQAARPMSANLTVFIHLLSDEGAIVAQTDSQPFSGHYPTSVWTQGELLADTYSLILPPELPAGPYRIVVGLYIAQTQSRLPAYNEVGERFPNDRVVLADVELK